MRIYCVYDRPIPRCLPGENRFERRMLGCFGTRAEAEAEVDRIVMAYAEADLKLFNVPTIEPLKIGDD